MPFVETEFWALEVPEEWSAEDDEGVIVIFDGDEIGELSVSVLVTDDESPEILSLQEKAEKLTGESNFDSIVIGDLNESEAVYREYSEDDAFWREWLVSSQSIDKEKASVVNEDLLIYVTYCTDLENKSLDDVVVNQILSTLVFVDEDESE